MEFGWLNKISYYVKKTQYFRRLFSYYSKNKINTYDDLSLEIAITIKNVLIFNKFVFIKSHNY